MAILGNNGTRGVCWGKLKINWNNGYHPYHNHETGTNMLTSEETYQGNSIA